LPAQRDQVDVGDIEPAGDIAEEVVRPLGGVAEVAQGGDGVVEDTLARADQQNAPLRVSVVMSSPVFSGLGGSDCSRGQGRAGGSIAGAVAAANDAVPVTSRPGVTRVMIVLP
jgi:hypothetical protein